MKSFLDFVWVNNMEDIIYLDSHAHLMSEDYSENLEDVMQRCKEKHIDYIMIITLTKQEALRAIEFKKRDPEHITIATGIFPEDAEKISADDWNDFVKIASRDEISVIGEIGLEYHWVKEEDARKKQRELFIRQIELAKTLHKPIAVHSRDAIQDTFDILKEHQVPGLIHCFPGTKEMAKEFTKLGYYIAFGGALTFKNARHSVEVVETIDEKYLLSETDCPYMAPVPVRGTKNEPSNIPYIVQKMADVRNVSVEHMASTILENWKRYLKCQ